MVVRVSGEEGNGVGAWRVAALEGNAGIILHTDGEAFFNFLLISVIVWW